MLLLWKALQLPVALCSDDDVLYIQGSYVNQKHLHEVLLSLALDDLGTVM